MLRRKGSILAQELLGELCIKLRHPFLNPTNIYIQGLNYGLSVAVAYIVIFGKVKYFRKSFLKTYPSKKEGKLVRNTIKFIQKGRVNTSTKALLSKCETLYPFLKRVTVFFHQRNVATFYSGFFIVDHFL